MLYAKQFRIYLMLNKIFFLLSFFLFGCSPSVHPIKLIEIFGKYTANIGKSSLWVNKDGTYYQEVYVDSKLVKNSGKWTVEKSDNEYNIPIHFFDFVFHISVIPSDLVKLGQPMGFETGVEKYNNSNLFSTEEHITICHREVCFVKTKTHVR
jgi:hypothetical protein